MLDTDSRHVASEHTDARVISDRNDVDNNSGYLQGLCKRAMKEIRTSWAVYLQ